MPHIIYAATRSGYAVQVLNGDEVVYEYTAGNCWQESQTTIDPDSPNAVAPNQLKRWARQTATEIANERGIVAVEYDPDLETQLSES